MLVNIKVRLRSTIIVWSLKKMRDVVKLAETFRESIQEEPRNVRYECITAELNISR